MEPRVFGLRRLLMPSAAGEFMHYKHFAAALPCYVYEGTVDASLWIAPQSSPLRVDVNALPAHDFRECHDRGGGLL